MKSGLKAHVLIPGNLPEPLTYDVGGISSDLAIPGMLVEVPFHKGSCPGLILSVDSAEVPFKTREITAVIYPRPLSLQWIETLSWISAYYHASLSKVFGTAMPKPVFRLLKSRASKGPSVHSDIAVSPETLPEPRYSLNPGQAAAVSAVSSRMKKGGFSYKSFLLHGITGSGKTLVYLHLTRLCLDAGKNALILLPEIALTPQTVSLFKGFLQYRVHTFHSNLSAGEKREIWQSLLDGSVRVLIGVRSAILTPIGNLGLIVVDEEHDTSYKQSDAPPRYNARDVAIYRASIHGCPVVLGSATPSMESYFAVGQKKHTLLEMNVKATKSAPPEIEIVDMKKQLLLQGRQLLSVPLRDALNQAMEQGGQAILFLNRRGFSKRRICRNCGIIQECPNCLLPLTHHKQAQRAACHFCHYSEPSEFRCRSCGSAKHIDTGTAIEKAEETLKKLYPEYGILRLDSDSTSRKGSVARIIETFRSGQARILLGTQMVAKGHDFKSVNLVGILEADTGLGLPDFRAQERVFQLITQVSGRAGRHSNSGKVIIQTYRPENPTFQIALDQNYSRFFMSELEHRRELGYPPYTRMVKIEFSGPDEPRVKREIERFSVFFENSASSGKLSILGPACAAIRKVRNNFRYLMIIRGSHPSILRQTVNSAAAAFVPERKAGLIISVDPDPMGMM